MGLKADPQAAMDFIVQAQAAQHWIVPVSRVLDGLENAKGGFELLTHGEAGRALWKDRH